MKKHIEQQDNEVFVGNSNVENGVSLPSHLSSLVTARLGEIAYDIHGKKIAPDYMRPLFVGASEEMKYDKIMMDRYSAIMAGRR